MRSAEDYWNQGQKADACYAATSYEMRKINGGMRILAPAVKNTNREDSSYTTAITLEFRAVGKNAVTVKAWHFSGIQVLAPHFDIKEEPVNYTVSETEDDYVLGTGDISVRVAKKKFSYSFESGGKVITRCGFKNLGYIQQRYMFTELSMGIEESIYGFGERFTNFVKNGQTIYTWNEDNGTVGSSSNKSVPFYLTNKGYGIFANNTGNVKFEVGTEKASYIGISVPGESLEYVFYYGPDLHEVLKNYSEMAGRPTLPPAWSFGLWFSNSLAPQYDEKTVDLFIEGMKELGVPLSVLHFDYFWMQEFRLGGLQWDTQAFPDPEAMLKRYHEKGLKICAWMTPYIAQNTDAFLEAANKGYLLLKADGTGIWQTDQLQYGMAIVDLTNPNACQWYKEKLIQLVDIGVDIFKIDFDGEIPVNIKYYDGSDPYLMHNYYSYLYNKCVFEVLESVKGKNNSLLLSGSATAGGQQFPVHWRGNCRASYSSMAETLRGGLSLSITGFSFWSHDITGFDNTPTADLYKRWIAFAMLSSHSCFHGSRSYRVPWFFDDEAGEVLRRFVNLKYELMPYLYEKAVEAHLTGVPMMRPMVLEFTKDPAVRYLDMQYMMGDALLVAPVFSEDGYVRYYLPEGRWTDYFTNETKEGGRWYESYCDYMTIPLYVRENSFLPTGCVNDHPDYEYEKNLKVTWYCPKSRENAIIKIVKNDGSMAGKIYAKRNGQKIMVMSTVKFENLKFEVIDKKNAAYDIQVTETLASEI